VNGKTIRIFLADGEPTGILLAEISNWTGKVIVAPRSQLAQLGKRDEVRRTGVYLLVGPDPNDSSRQLVYVGETDNVLKRLASHNRNEAKDFWERTVVVVSKDENLTKSHVRFLESRLIKLAQDARRANLTNDTTPEPASLPEPDVADMEFFVEQVQMILPVLGFDFTQPRVGAGGPAGDKSPLFVLRQVGALATAQEIDGQFVVLAKSTARKKGVESWKYARHLREKLVAEESLVDSDDPACLVFAEDVAFSSPSAAATVVMARNANGRKLWKVKGGTQTYGQWQETKLAETGVVAEAEGADED
jgi:predicted GIY-YIG superfamily endonuclease